MELKTTELGNIPKDWKECTFQDVLEGFSSGMTPYRGNPEYYSGNIPWITSGELNYNIIVDTDEKITQDAVLKTNLKILPIGTFLMAITGLEAAGTRGSCGITGIRATTNQSCMALFPKKNKITTDYLFHFYVNYGDELAFKFCQGSKQQSYTAKIAKILPINLPPTIEEQKAIAQVLSDTDSLIAGIEQKLAKKRAIKQGAMQELLRPKEGWEVKSFPEMCWFQEGPGVRKHQFTTSGVKLLNGTNIEKGRLLLEKTDKYVSESEANGWYSHFLVDSGDILIACSGITISKFEEKVTIANSVHLPLCMNTSTMRFKTKNEKLYKNYLFHFLKSDSFKIQIGGKATGSAQLNFGPSHVSKVMLSMPSYEKQKEIATILSDMDSEINQIEEKLSKYKVVKQGLMQQLLTGKIRLI